MTFLNRHRSRIRPVGPFAPSSLFFGGIPGAWYDPTDLSTMFQDSAGTTPVTAVEQPVGLILDKSQGLTLGAELVTNGDFSGGTTGWTGSNATLSIVGGALRFTVTANGQAGAYQQIATTAGRTYKATFTFVADAANGNTFFNAGTTTTGAQLASINCGSTTGTYTMYFVATGAISYISVITSSTALAGQTNDVTGFTVRELAGNHASQSTAASRPTYRARYNLLTYSEQFDNGAWSKAGATVSANSTVAPDGTMTADTLTESAATSDHFTWQNLPLLTTAARYTASVYAKYSGRFIILILSNAVSGDAYAYFDLQNGVISQAAATTGAMWSSATATIENVGSGWYRCTLTATKDATGNAQPQVRTSDVGTGGSSRSYAGNGTSGAFLWGAQLLTAADVTATGNAYQRIAAATVYDTAPVFRPYLAFDGLDDSLSTAAINFTSTDKMSVFSGVTKNSDATAYGIMAELSANSNTTNGTFSLWVPGAPALGGSFDVLLRGTGAGAYSPAPFPAPITVALTALYDIGAAALSAEVIPRVNMTVAQTTPGGLAGTGNFGNQPLFIGRRNNASNPLNGRIYSLIVRGAASSVTEIADTELWVNARTGAF